jgi:general secretion pathway protein A
MYVYAQYFGLRKNPFSMTPDPAFLFLTEQHREALVGLTYAITQRKGFVTLTGEVGTGKTTLLARVLQFLPASKLQYSLIMNPTLTPSEFFELALLDFGVEDIPASKAQRIWTLQNLLMQGEREGKVSALIVDEAHRLSPEVLEEIRLLGNFEATDQKILQIVLAGQPELDVALRRADLRQLKQRIAMKLFVRPLQMEEVGKYIRHRWLRAGGGEPPFSEGAVSRIAEASRGIPRVINGLCDNAMTAACAVGSLTIQESHVREAVTDLDLGTLAFDESTEETVDDPPPDRPSFTATAGDSSKILLQETDESPPPLPPREEVRDVPVPPPLPAEQWFVAPQRPSVWTRFTGKFGFRRREGTT